MESPADDDEELLAILKEAREAANQAFERFFSCHNNNNTSPAPAPAPAAAAAAALPDQNDVGGSGVVQMVVRRTKMYPPTLLCGMHPAQFRSIVRRAKNKKFHVQRTKHKSRQDHCAKRQRCHKGQFAKAANSVVVVFGDDDNDNDDGARLGPA